MRINLLLFWIYKKEIQTGINLLFWFSSCTRQIWNRDILHIKKKFRPQGPQSSQNQLIINHNGHWICKGKKDFGSTRKEKKEWTEGLRLITPLLKRKKGFDSSKTAISHKKKKMQRKIHTAAGWSIPPWDVLRPDQFHLYWGNDHTIAAVVL